MNRDAEILWEVARILARDAAEVSPAAHDLPPLLFFTDPERTPRPWETAARLPAGSAVVHRGFDAPDAAETAARLREATREAGVLLLVGLDAELAATVKADGVHLPQRALRDAEAIRAAHPDWLVTGAAHDAGALADGGGLQASVLSPVFPAGGASGQRPALGADRLRTLVKAAPRPTYALGGIDAQNAASLIGCGVCGLAGIGAIQAAFGPI